MRTGTKGYFLTRQEVGQEGEGRKTRKRENILRAEGRRGILY